MITERTLRQWRRKALIHKSADLASLYEHTADGLARLCIEDQDKILQLTQELMDLHLMKDKTKGE